eukprot:c9549_g1_i2.p1 GENE.c9549_g1_i2~~c9549_g1_i2.p1  ORF type:complete len:227 (+),score=6.28 c9549_g1_i2:70-750(+)
MELASRRSSHPATFEATPSPSPTLAVPRSEPLSRRKVETEPSDSPLLIPRSASSRPGGRSPAQIFSSLRRLSASPSFRRRTHCVICCDATRNTRLPCGHSIMCDTCCRNVLAHSKTCPTCRAPFRSFYVDKKFSTLPLYVNPATDPDSRGEELVKEEDISFTDIGSEPISLTPEAVMYIDSLMNESNQSQSSTTKFRSRALRLFVLLCLGAIFQGFIFMSVQTCCV